MIDIARLGGTAILTLAHGKASALDLELLKAGGSMLPEELGQIVGVDLTDPGFWNAGLDLIERQLEAAEEIAGQ